MLEGMKEEVQATLIFLFIEHSKMGMPNGIEILGMKKLIPKDTTELEFKFSDFSINEFKIYNCFISYESEIKESMISVYYNKINYFLCGKGSHSVEIIFCDFIYKKIQDKNCKIQYKGKSFSPKENFGLSTRKRINFINIDIEHLKLPEDLKGNPVTIDTKDNKNFLINISVSNKPKIIGVFLNSALIEKTIVIQKELLDEIKMKIDKVKNILNYEEGKDLFKYLKGVNKKKLKEFEIEVKNSYELEMKIAEHFNLYKKNISDIEIELFELYSEFMILFPDFPSQSRNSPKTNLYQYYYQYYFSKSSIQNLYHQIPKDLEKSEKARIKYTACRCLKTLLYNGYGTNREDLFDFIDFNNKGTIYFEANEFNKQFITFLNERSEIFIFFLQLNSGSGINLLTNKNTARLSMLNEGDIKAHLNSSIPKYGIRFNSNSSFNACTFNEVRITCFCEINIFQYYLSSDKLKSEYDFSYSYRYILANLLQHEDFGHIKFSINFYSFYDKNLKRDNSYDPLSPITYYKTINNEGMVDITVKEEKPNTDTIIKGESGIALLYFLTRGDRNLMKLLRIGNSNFENLFKNPSMLASENLSEFINELKKLSDYSEDENNTSTSRIKYDYYDYRTTIPVGIPTTEKFF